jgi:hypothetical protein
MLCFTSSHQSEEEHYTQPSQPRGPTGLEALAWPTKEQSYCCTGSSSNTFKQLKYLWEHRTSGYCTYIQTELSTHLHQFIICCNL